MTPQEVEKLCRLMQRFQLESLKVSPEGGFEATKKLHIAKSVSKKNEDTDDPMSSDMSDEDLMFYSSGSPRLKFRPDFQNLERRPEPEPPPPPADPETDGDS